MVTVYHPDGKNVLLMHYCSMGNQPRMRSKGYENGKIAFAYVDATNVKTPGELRMTRLLLTFPDADHLLQEWTSKAGAREDTGRFTFTRKK